MTMSVILTYIGKAILWAWLVMAVGFVLFIIYVYSIRDWVDYRQARKEIFAFVKAHKQKCTGNNRFVVTVESLQYSFREYNTNIILNVWLDLINEHVIVSDPEDQVWCIR
jgi:hypothetical protein